MQSFPPYNQIPEKSSRMNRLLLILIFTFLASGGALLVLKQIDTYHRQQIYLATQATLPEHKTKTACAEVPSEIKDNSVYKEWFRSSNIQGSFCGGATEVLKYDLAGKTIFTDSNSCKKAFNGYPGVLANSPNGERGVCLSSFGEPDSYVILFSNIKAEQGRLRFCGTACGFDNGFWLNNNQFVLLKTSNLEGTDTYGFEVMDFESKTQQNWEINRTDMANLTDEKDVKDWKTYRNEELGFEFKYPSKYQEFIDLENSNQPSVPIITLLSLEPNNDLFLTVRHKVIPTDQSFKEIILDSVIFDGSGLHPKSLDMFKIISLGENKFYFIQSGLFEGILSYEYFLINKQDLFWFYFRSNGVDWTNPDFNGEIFPPHLEWKKILSTFKFTK